MTDLAGASWSPNALHILVGAGGLLALAGVPGLLLDRRSPWGQRMANGLILAACAVGLVGAFLMLRATHELRLDLPSPFPGQRSVLGVDALSAWFAVPVLVVGGLGSISGAILAAATLTAAPELLRGLGDWRMVLYSLLLIAMMLSRPQGLLGQRELWPISLLTRGAK